MIRVFYNNSGVILYTVSDGFGREATDLYIDVEGPVHLTKVMVDTENKCLIDNPNYSEPQPYTGRLGATTL